MTRPPVPQGRVWRPLHLVLGIAACLLVLYGLSVAEFLRQGPLIQADHRIATLMHDAQTPAGLWIAAHVTALGDWRVTSLVSVAACVAFWLLGRVALAIGLVIATTGQAMTVPLLKDLFDRSRPVFAHFREASPSFPSGHAAVSIALFGFVGYALWRAGVTGARRAFTAMAAVILSVGFTRIYLAEHYLSDVLNGYLVGGLWLMIGIVASEWLLSAPLPPTPARRRLAGLSVLPFILSAGLVVATYDKVLTTPGGADATDGG